MWYTQFSVPPSKHLLVDVPKVLFSWASLHLDTTLMMALPASRVHSIMAGVLGSVFSASGTGDGGLIFALPVHYNATDCL